MNPIETAKIHISKIRQLMAANEIVWTTLPVPKENAMRAFQGIAKGYLFNVVQANVTQVGVMCDGVAVVADCGLIMRLPRDLAEELYRSATTARN